MNLHQAKLDIVEAGRRVYERGFVASNDGNISCRVEEDRILTTPTGMSKGFLKVEDLCITDMDGTLVSGQKRPSSELGCTFFSIASAPMCALWYTRIRQRLRVLRLQAFPLPCVFCPR